MLIMFIKRFEILGYWRLGCYEVLLLLLFFLVCVYVQLCITKVQETLQLPGDSIILRT